MNRKFYDQQQIFTVLENKSENKQSRDVNLFMHGGDPQQVSKIPTN